MTDYSVTVQAYFDASHVVEDMAGCSTLHGHTWLVRAAIEGPLEQDENGLYRVRELDVLPQHALDLLMQELDGRHLNDMLPATLTTPEGVAAWFLERLPTMDYVEVEMGWRKQTGRARRNKRR